jgi:lipopolysaccharide export system protein LptA
MSLCTPGAGGRRPFLAALAAALALVAAPAAAEKADREKPINIESNRMTADDAKQVAVFEGRVVLTQGTFVLRADRITVRQDKDGNQSGIAIGKPATFRQKRDGVDEWIEGEALRIEYDVRTDKVELFDRARVLRGQDEVRGNYISYDSRTEFMLVQDARDPKSATGPAPGGRVSATIQPKPRAPEPPAKPLELQPSPNPPASR